MNTPGNVLEALGFFADLSPESEQNFLSACKDGPTEAVRAYLDLGMSPDARADISLETALIKAAEGGSIERLTLLLERGAGLELRDYSGDTALRTALNWSHPDAVRFLASRGADLTAVNPHGESALEHAIRENKDDNVRLLLELGAPPDFASLDNDDGHSAMRKAIESGRVDTLTAMLDRGADPNRAYDTHGVTALHLAVRAENYSITTLLLDRGADPRALDAYGLSPRDYALERPWHDAPAALTDAPSERELTRASVWRALPSGSVSDALEALRRADLPIDTRNAKHQTALMLVCESANLESARALLAAGADPNAEGAWGNTAMSASVDQNAPALVELLIAHGARGTNRKRFPKGLSNAVYYEHEEVVRAMLPACSDATAEGLGEALRAAVMKQSVALVTLLCDHGADVNYHAEIGGDTPLIGAARYYRSDDVVRCLLARGADVNAVEGMQKTALHGCVEHHGYDDEYLSTLRILLDAGAGLDALDMFGRTPFDSARDLSRAHLQQLVVDEPLATGASFASLAPSQNWATLAIWYAAGRLDAVRAFLELGVPVQPPAGRGATPLLHRAVEKRDHEAVALILAHGADVNQLAHYGTSALSSAAFTGDLALLDTLLAHGAVPYARDTLRGSPAHSGAAHVEVLKRLAEHGVDYARDTVDTPLMRAASQGALASVEYLLSRGARPTVSQPYGDTALNAAIVAGHTAVALALIRAGASLTLVERRSGDTPLQAAAKVGSVPIVRALLDAGADLRGAVGLLAQRRELRAAFAAELAALGIDVSAPTEVTPLPEELTRPSAFWRAVYGGDVEAVRAMIADGHAVDAADPWGATALMYAVAADDLEQVSALLDAGASALTTDPSGATAFGYGSFANNTEIEAKLQASVEKRLLSMDALNAKARRAMLSQELNDAIERGELNKLSAMLRERRINPYTGITGQSVLNRAIAAGDADLIEHLLALGLSVNAADLKGATPLAMALQRADDEQAERFVAAGADPNLRVRGVALALRCLEAYDGAAARWLLDHGADLSAATNRDGQTALHLAIARSENSLAIALATRHPALVHATDASGSTPLHVAVSQWNDEGARVLLRHGASWDAVAEGVDGAASARALAASSGLDPASWPGDELAVNEDGDAVN